MKKAIRIFLVDDHEDVREGLQHMLDREEDMEVVGGAGDAKEALTQVTWLSPHVILTDIKMPGMDGIEFTQQLKDRFLSCNVIMLTLYDEYLAEAMEAGAAGYILKDASREELTQAIRQVHYGQVVISDSIVSKHLTEHQRRDGEKVERGLAQAYSGSSTMVKEVHLAVHPRSDASRLMRFITSTEEVLESRISQAVGSCKGGTAITFRLEKPTPLVNILNRLGEIPGVEVTGEEPMTEKSVPRFFKKADATERQKITLNRTIFISLKDY